MRMHKCDTSFVNNSERHFHGYQGPDRSWTEAQINLFIWIW